MRNIRLVRQEVVKGRRRWCEREKGKKKGGEEKEEGEAERQVLDKGSKRAYI
jgi:hypothetical protein